VKFAVSWSGHQAEGNTAVKVAPSWTGHGSQGTIGMKGTRVNFAPSGRENTQFLEFTCIQT